MLIRRISPRYRLDKRGNAVVDARQFTPEFLNPDELDYRKGSPIFLPRRSSPARLAFKALRNERRAANRPARIYARIANAAAKAHTA